MGNCIRSKDHYIRTICMPLWTLQTWRTAVIRQFGSVAESSPAFNRLCDYLMTRPGLQKVQHCLQSNCKLHGNSDNEPGIKDQVKWALNWIERLNEVNVLFIDVADPWWSISIVIVQSVKVHDSCAGVSWPHQEFHRTKSRLPAQSEDCFASRDGWQGEGWCRWWIGRWSTSPRRRWGSNADRGGSFGSWSRAVGISRGWPRPCVHEDGRAEGQDEAGRA